MTSSANIPAFADRHIGPSDSDLDEMLTAIGVTSLAELADQVVPDSIRDDGALEYGAAASEQEALAELRAIMSQNKVVKSFIGQGYHGCHVPPVIQRNLFENPGWYTAYTPYQPEIAQGRLEALFNFQTVTSELTALPVANASLLDEATAVAEAMTMAYRAAKEKKHTVLADKLLHPQSLAILQTRAQPLGITVEVVDLDASPEPGEDCFGIIVQYPDTTGAIRDFRSLAAGAKAKGVLVIASADLLALTLLSPPGDWGADIAVGSCQRFGVPFGFGGPHAAYMTCTDALKRSMPGRIVGLSVDTGGRPAYRLALQTREQHIRREKATSNICTAQALLAIMAAMYAAWHGPDGLVAMARRIHGQAARLAAALTAAGHKVTAEHFFDTVTIETGVRTDELVTAALAAGFNLRRLDDNTISIALDETTMEADLTALTDAFGAPLESAAMSRLPADLGRTGDFMSQDCFHAYRSETEMMRYLRKLMDMDLALDRAMIPLGSCTMKLNAAAEMAPVSWPETANIHPYAPLDQAAGYLKMIGQLEDMLCAVTGFDALSLQPNAGSQGEYAGLLAIKGWHTARGEGHRSICLIPSSAHGTNPASAHMTGMKVVIVNCDDNGNVDVDDLKAKAAEHADNLAALMITYPSTHGVFETAIREICDTIHAHGGQVYLDGANMNALVGQALPGKFGADVSHLNLHKTFCIPHGGGGPGVGPIGVGEHLIPFLPRETGDNGRDQPPVAAAPWGSASILPISWMYMRMMGGDGLAKATLAAIAGANYIASRLSGHFEVLYTGANGRVAHECILDVRPFKDSAGVTVDDIAKRLIDYGFHAPTMSWPVAGTLMVEPTESESKAEFDRFCTAMISIRSEIREIEEGRWSRDDNPLINAPHIAADLMTNEWSSSYPRELGAFPDDAMRASKYWPPVGRVDNAYGDRNLVCTCPPLEDYAEAG